MVSCFSSEQDNATMRRFCSSVAGSPRKHDAPTSFIQLAEHVEQKGIDVEVERLVIQEEFGWKACGEPAPRSDATGRCRARAPRLTDVTEVLAVNPLLEAVYLEHCDE